MKRTIGIHFSYALIAVMLVTGIVTAKTKMKDRGPHQGPYWSQLDETQKTELKEKIEALKADGADREKIRETVNAQLQEWGIEAPPFHPDSLYGRGWRGHGPGPGPNGPFQNLTEEQQKELHEMIQAKLKEWGIEAPELPPDGPGPMHQNWMNSLDNEQKKSVDDLIQKMQEEGKSREEIHEAIKTLVAEYGIELPAEPSFKKERHGKCEQRHHESN